MIQRCLDFSNEDRALFYKLVNEAKEKTDFCKDCLLKDDCEQKGERYNRVMRCFDCEETMQKIDEIKLLGIDKKLSTLEFFVCWKDKRHRINMR